MATLKLRLFTVVGRGRFPIDMLRYDSCWPYDGTAVLNIDPDEQREVRLATYGTTTPGRWQSFGWTVKK
jgi:hypothetical protein